MRSPRLHWQSKTVLLAVFPVVGAGLVLALERWLADAPLVAVCVLVVSAVLGLIAWESRAATPSGAWAGTALTASLMFSTTGAPCLPWRTALVPVFAVLVLTSVATRLGRRRKEQLGTAERHNGRVAAQVAANLGAAALLATEIIRLLLADTGWFPPADWGAGLLFAPMLAALCEAVADTVSSELGQILSSHPRLITTLRVMEPGTDGAVSLGGTLAGIFAAALVAASATAAMPGGWIFAAIGGISGVFGLFFDSLLGATLERRDLLNNDAVNFLSTLSAAAFALALLALVPHLGLG